MSDGRKRTNSATGGISVELEKVIGYDALYESMIRCKNGVLWKDSVARFFHHAPLEILKLSNELKTGTYQQRLARKFEIVSPKRREVIAAAFRDRVFQRSLNDNIVYPKIIRHFVYDNSACQAGKGTSFAQKRLHCFLQRFYRKNGLNGYVLQCDILGYYPNIQHGVAEAEILKYFSPEIQKLIKIGLACQGEGETGYFPGSQLVQIVGMATLNSLDHYIKERLRIKYYMRYMDDFLLIHEDGEYLVECCRQIAAELAKIGLKLHPKKTRIFPLTERIKFLGFYHFLTPTGKVVMLVDPQNVKQQRRRLKRLVRKAQRGGITREKVDQCYESWRAHAKQGNSYRLLKRMDAYYKELWEKK